MFNCSGPTLVFVTQTAHPLLEHPTGLIFALYNVQDYKPRELFFENFLAVQAFAQGRARIEMDPARKPERVTSADYLTIIQDESQFINMPELRGRFPRHRKKEADQEFSASLLELEQEFELEADFEVGDDPCPE